MAVTIPPYDAALRLTLAISARVYRRRSPSEKATEQVRRRREKKLW